MSDADDYQTQFLRGLQLIVGAWNGLYAAPEARATRLFFACGPVLPKPTGRNAVQES